MMRSWPSPRCLRTIFSRRSSLPPPRSPVRRNLVHALRDENHQGAWIARFRLADPTPSTSLLANKTFGVKDLFAIQNHPTSFGNPTWLATKGHPPLTTAPSVTALLKAGAICLGKTHMDELAYSLNGENVHYGTPINPAAPDRIPGGSSSGSAVAVAAQHVDFALGTDTAGSVRVPASYCGIIGYRPTHGAISLQGGEPLAQSFDTCGIFVRRNDVDLLTKVSSVLWTDTTSRTPPPLERLLVAHDIMALLDPDIRDAFLHASTRFPSPLSTTTLATPLTGPITTWFDVFRVLQGVEVHRNHGDWIASAKPSFGPGIRERFDMASQLTQQQLDVAQPRREAIRARLDELLRDDTVLVLPTTPGPAPLCKTPPAELDAFRQRLLAMTCISGLARLPEVSLPLLKSAHGLPVGLSLLGPRGSDASLLQLAKEFSSLFSKM